jgi:hypothetical protein
MFQLLSQPTEPARDLRQPETAAQAAARARRRVQEGEAFGRGAPLSATLKDECTICLGELAKGQLALTLRCGHIFHEACIYEWLGRRAHCPLCKQGVL